MLNPVFVLEKDEDILEIIGLVLSDKGFSVKSCRSEEGAMDMILRVKPSAIILDMFMVNELNAGLCRQIKTNKLTMDTPIIILTTNQQPKSLMGIQANQVIQKPFDIDELADAVGRAVMHKADMEYA